VEIPPAEPARRLAELRCARYGSLLARHWRLLGAAGRPPSEIAAVLCCSRSSVYRVGKAYRAGTLTGGDASGAATGRVRRRVLTPSRQRSVVAILKTVPWAWGWCRPRWSCATVAWELHARRGGQVSSETMRQWLHDLGWVWKRATLAAKDDAPQRVEKLARSRQAFAQVPAKAARFFAEEFDIQLWPKVGYQGMPKADQVEVPTPGTTEKRDLAGALDMRTGTLGYRVGWRKPPGRFLPLLQTLEHVYPPRRFTHLYGGVDNFKIHQAQAVEQWLAAHPRVELLFLPPSCPNASPIERAFGEVHAQCPRPHKRQRLWSVVREVEQPLPVNGPWRSEFSESYYTTEVTAAVQALRLSDPAPGEISQLAA